MKKIDMQIEEYLQYCERVRRMLVTTMSQKRNVLERFAVVSELRRIEDLTNEIFNRWVELEVERGINASSVNAYIAVVVAMVRYCREKGLVVPINLSLVVKLKESKSRRRFYMEEEVDEVVKRADSMTGLMIRIMFETGMRIAELTRLKVSDFEGRRVRFVGKGRKPREVYLRVETLRWLERYVREYGVTEYLWAVHDGLLACNGEPPTVNTVRERMRRAFRVAGFDGFYPHALRHSFATNLQLKGATVAEIKEMIGHSSIATTERYLHGFEGRMQELFDKYW